MIGRRARRPAFRSGGPPSVVELDIEELVLEGFDRVDATRIGRAVEAELTRQLATQPLPASAIDRSADVLHERSDVGAGGRDPEFVGGRIGAAVHAAIRGDRAAPRPSARE